MVQVRCNLPLIYACADIKRKIDTQFLMTLGSVTNGNMFNCVMSEKKKTLKVPHTNVKEVFQNLITREDVKILVKKSVLGEAELVDCRLQPFSEEKLGYLGSHFCLVVTAREPGKYENQVRHFFAKTLPYDVPATAAFVEEKGCFQKETKFFELVVPLMTDNVKGEGWTPKCYMTKANVMVFENLKPEGYSNRIRMLDEKSIKATFGSLARMHASSLIAEERIQGKSLRALFPDVFVESEFGREGRNHVNITVGVNLAIDLAKDMDLDSSNIPRASERVFDIVQSSKTKRNVVCHGDLWSSNVIFDPENHCRLVDFQMVRYLPPGHDLMLLLYYGAATEVRQKHEQQLVKFYYQVFTETLKLNNFEGEVPSLEEILQGIEELRLQALFTAVLFHPIVLLDTQMATKIMNDPVMSQTIFFGDRKSIVKNYMSKNPEYKKKIQDNVKELVKMSLMIDSIPRFT